nr:MAG TPA: hypothetical protein [Caudoviricetes sp.]
MYFSKKNYTFLSYLLPPSSSLVISHSSLTTNH